MSAYAELKRHAWLANKELPKAGLVTKTFGNASAFDAERRVFAIKPSGVPFESLHPEEMVVVDIQAKVVEGSLGRRRTRGHMQSCTPPGLTSAGSSIPTPLTLWHGHRP